MVARLFLHKPIQTNKPSGSRPRPSDPFYDFGKYAAIPKGACVLPPRFAMLLLKMVIE